MGQGLDICSQIKFSPLIIREVRIFLSENTLGPEKDQFIRDYHLIKKGMDGPEEHYAK